MITFCITGQIVEMKQKLYSMSLKMLHISLCLNTQNSYLEMCKVLPSSYILVLGFKFVYIVCSWSFATAAFWGNVQSMFNQHIKPHHTWDISCLPYFKPLTERTQQCHGFDWLGQCLLKLVSSLPICAEAVDGLHVSLASILVQPLPTFSSEGRFKNLCVKFSFHCMKIKRI
jgi:hypothetical protein